MTAHQGVVWVICWLRDLHHGLSWLLSQLVLGQCFYNSGKPNTPSTSNTVPGGSLSRSYGCSMAFVESAMLPALSAVLEAVPFGCLLMSKSFR